MIYIDGAFVYLTYAMQVEPDMSCFYWHFVCAELIFKGCSRQNNIHSEWAVMVKFPGLLLIRKIRKSGDYFMEIRSAMPLNDFDGHSRGANKTN